MAYAIIGFVLALAVAGFYVDSKAYDRGVSGENSRWIQVRIDEQTEVARNLSLVSESKEKMRLAFMRAENETEKDIKKLNSTMRRMHNSGLFIVGKKTSTCESDRATEDKDTKVRTEGTARERLPEETEIGLLGMTEDAQTCVIEYYKLKKKFESLPFIEMVE